MENQEHLSEQTLQELKSIRELFPFESKFISVPVSQIQSTSQCATDNRTLHYIDEGEGEPIVFVHGNPTWSFYFRKVIDSLKISYRCIALDNLGCGLSEKPKDLNYRLLDRGYTLQNFLDALGVQKCHLVVHDWGGAIAMAFATRNPERVASVTLTNTAAFPSEWISWRIQMCRLPVIGRFLNYHLNGFLRAAMIMTTLQPLDKLTKKGYLLPYRKLADRESIDQFVKDIPMSESHPSYPELKRIEQGLPQIEDRQVLLLWGLRDFCFSKYFLDRWMKFYPKANAVVFKDGDHFLFEENALQCSDWIDKHLLKNPIE